AEVVDVEVAEVDVAALEAAATVCRAEAVVLLALLGVREQVVRALDLLEPLLGRGVTGIAVRVVLARELAVGLLSLCRHSLPWERTPQLVPAAGRGRRAGSPSAAPRSRCPRRRRKAVRAAP